MSEKRRRNFGWFGEPWPSGICYADDGRLLEEMHITTPVGEPCIACEEPFADGDRGKAMPFEGRITHIHIECLYLETAGPARHQSGGCTGAGRCHDPSLTPRQEALQSWEWAHRNYLQMPLTPVVDVVSVCLITATTEGE